MDERMLSRNLGRFQNDADRGGPPERRTAIKRVALAIGGLQPGSLLFGCVHDSVFTKKSWLKQSISDGEASFFRQTQGQTLRTGAKARKRRQVCPETLQKPRLPRGRKMNFDA